MSYCDLFHASNVRLLSFCTVSQILYTFIPLLFVAFSPAACIEVAGILAYFWREWVVSPKVFACMCKWARTHRAGGIASCALNCLADRNFAT